MNSLIIVSVIEAAYVIYMLRYFKMKIFRRTPVGKIQIRVFTSGTSPLNIQIFVLSVI